MRLLPVFVCLLFIGAGGLRMGEEIRRANRVERLELDGAWSLVSGTVAERREEGGRLVLVLEACTAAVEKERIMLRGIQVYAEAGGDTIRIGSRIQAAGTLSAYSHARNPGSFDGWLYARARKLDCRMYAETVEVEGQSHSRFREGLRQIAVRAGQILDQISLEEDAGVYRAAILGDRSGLDAELRDLYQRNGIAHLLAISGLHMSLIGMAVYRLFRRLGAGYGWAGVAGAVFVVSYGMMTGGSASVVRASVMLLSGFGAAYLGRTYDLLSALALACLLLVWDSPYLITQAGMQLSFGAVFGIGGMTRSMEGIFGPERKGSVLWQGLTASLCVQLVTAPVILYHYYEFPLYGMLLNLVVVPLMAYVVSSGLIGILAGALHLQAGVFVVGTGHYILAFYQILCRFCECLPLNNLVLGRPEPWQIAGYYLVLGTVWTGAEKGWLRRRRTAAAGMVLAAVCLCPLPVHGLEVTFLDVGQGDGICLRTNTCTMLVDGGSSDEKRLGEYTLEPFFKSEAVTQIDYAWVSHGDQDHINGFVALLEEGRDLKVVNLMLPVLGREDEVYEPLCQLVRRQGGQIFWVEAGDVLRLGEMMVTCLYPGKDHIAADRNEQSMVLKVDYGAFHLLLTGDMSETGERSLLEDAVMGGLLPEIQVLKLAHHGSRFSNSELWLEQVQPVWAVVSYGKGNRYGHPHREVRERLEQQGIPLWETAASGAVRLWTDGEKLRWDTCLPNTDKAEADG